jgi:hypothetical protein
MYDLLKSLAQDNDWFFEYSRTDYQNLYDGMEKDKIHLFVDPIIIDSKFSDSGNETKTYSGKIMLLISSDVGSDYTTKYNAIQPLMDGALQFLKAAFICSEYTFNKFQTIEVINLFDVNLDGLLITYNVTAPV